eukprot:232770_1
MNSFSCRNVGNNINVYMILITFFCMLITNTGSTLISWNISTTLLPKEIYNHACGYDSATKNIFLHSGWVKGGGTESLNAYSYNIDTPHNTKSFNSFTGAKKTEFYSPAYINSPYWYFFRNNKFGQFIPDTISPSLDYPLSSFTNNQSPYSTTSGTTIAIVYACITISLDGDYLIVTGGYTSASMSNMQIYNKVSGYWITGQAPNMNSNRDSHGCIVSNNNILYAIGGYNTQSSTNELDTIETIDMSDNTASWDMNTNTGYKLKSKKHKINCVLYENNIYVIGGEKMNLNYVSEVDIIDTTTKLVTAGPLLPVSNGIAGSCSVIVNDRIYVLGGYNAQEYEGTNTIIISNSLRQPTVSPTTTAPTTSNPTTGSPTTTIPTTNPPTSIPTTLIPTSDNPTTNVPTTAIPTTNMPTTHIPTTDNPTTNIPTTSVPTNIPTTTNPTTTPTLLPTLQPTYYTSNPSKYPTNNPTQIPTLIPTNNPIRITLQPTSTPVDDGSSGEQYDLHTTEDISFNKNDNGDGFLNNNGITSTYFIYIIVGAALLCCCFIGLFFKMKCRKLKQRKNDQIYLGPTDLVQITSISGKDDIITPIGKDNGNYSLDTNVPKNSEAQIMEDITDIVNGTPMGAFQSDEENVDTQQLKEGNNDEEILTDVNTLATPNGIDSNAKQNNRTEVDTDSDILNDVDDIDINNQNNVTTQGYKDNIAEDEFIINDDQDIETDEGTTEEDELDDPLDADNIADTLDTKT